MKITLLRKWQGINRPKTTSALFESGGMAAPYATKLVEDAMDGDGDGDETLDAIMSLIGQVMSDSSLDAAGKKKKVGAIIMAHSKLSGTSTPESADEEDNAMEACVKEAAFNPLTPNDDADGPAGSMNTQHAAPAEYQDGKAGNFIKGKAVKEAFEEVVNAALKPLVEAIAELKGDKAVKTCEALLESANREITPIRLKTLKAASPVDRAALIESWPERTSPAPRVARPARSYPLIESDPDEPGCYSDAKSLIGACQTRNHN